MMKKPSVLHFLISIFLIYVGLTFVFPKAMGLNFMGEIENELGEKITYEGFHMKDLSFENGVRNGIENSFSGSTTAPLGFLIYFFIGFSWLAGLILSLIYGKVGISFVYSTLIGTIITCLSLIDLVLSVIKGKNFGGDLMFLVVGTIFLAIGISSFLKYRKCIILRKGKPIYAKVIKYQIIKKYSFPTSLYELQRLLDYGALYFSSEKIIIALDDGIYLYDKIFPLNKSPEGLKHGVYVPIYFNSDKSSYRIDYENIHEKEPSSYIENNREFYGVKEDLGRRKIHSFGEQSRIKDLVLGIIFLFLSFLILCRTIKNGDLKEFFIRAINLLLFSGAFYKLNEVIKIIKTKKIANELKKKSGEYLTITSIVENKRIFGELRSYYIIASDNKNSYKSCNFSTSNITEIVRKGDKVTVYIDKENNRFRVDLSQILPGNLKDNEILNEKTCDEKEKMDYKINKTKGIVNGGIDLFSFIRSILKK